MNAMKDIRIEKVTLNIGAGKDQTRLEKGIVLLETISGVKPVKTFTKKRIPEWGLRPGLPIGCKVTIRKGEIKALIKRLLEAKDNTLKESQFDDSGSIAFGIPEYIDIGGIEYDPKIGVIGLEACITLMRPGYRIKRKSMGKGRIGKGHLINREDAIGFMKKEFGIKIEGE